MAVTFLHVGIPVKDDREGMSYSERMKLWKNNDVDIYDLKIEYLKFEEETPFPKCLQENPHVAYRTDDAEPLMAQADAVVFGPVDLRPGMRMVFIEKDKAYFEILEIKD